MAAPSTPSLHTVTVSFIMFTLATVLTMASEREPGVTKEEAVPFVRRIRNFAGVRQWRLVRRHNTLVPDIGHSDDLSPEDVVWLLGNVGRRRK